MNTNKPVYFYQKSEWQIGLGITFLLFGIGLWVSLDKASFSATCVWIYVNIIRCVIFWIVVVGITVFVFYKKGKIKVLSTMIKQKESKISELNRTIDDINSEITQKENNINNLNEIIINKEKEIEILKNKTNPFIKRWEEILENGIRFGSIKYPPMLDIDSDGDPIGIGIEILRKIFNGKIKKEYDNVTWQNLVDKLYEKNGDDKFKMDIIATPIFEINERSKLLSSSLPLFYTEIGLYYNSKCMSFKGVTKKSFCDAIQYINNIQYELNVQCIESELSCRMVKKHFKGKNVKTVSKSDLTMENLIATVIDDERNSDFVFAETYQAEKLIRNKISKGETEFNNLKNLFTERQLLYPVVFAMRREDYILKNYINLKLIELDGPGCGVSKLIRDSLNSIGENITDEDLKKYFIREYKDLISNTD